MSVVLQIVIVVVVWIVVKKSCSVDSQDGVTVRRIHSADDQGSSLCNPGDYVKGTALRIEDLVSVSGPQEQKRFFLEVDILARDSEQGSPILYSVGTPVIVDGLFQDDDLDFEKEEGKEKSEFYYDNSIEERDLGDDPHALPGENVEYDHPEDNAVEKEESMIEEETNEMDDNADSENNEGDILENSDNHAYQDVNGGQILQNINLNILNNGEQSEIERNPPAMHKTAESQLPQQNQIQHQVQGQIPLGPGHLPQQNGINDWGVQNQLRQRQPGIQYLPQQNQLNNQNGQSSNQFRAERDTISQEKPMNSPGVQQWPGQENKLSFGVQHGTNEFAVDDEVSMNAINKQNQNIPVENKGLPKMNQEQETISGGNSMTYSEGFKKRLTSFKTEFYGRPVDETSNQTPTTYMMNNPTLCQNTGGIDVLFMVHSIPQSDDQRQRIRDTFAKASLFQPFKIAHVFFVGQTSSPNFQVNLDKEQEQYNDIVQGGFMDSPDTQANKGLLGLHWVKTFCPQSRFVMKIDEDVFVDTDKLLQGLIPATTNVIGIKSMLCFLVQNASIPRSGPNALDPNVFPNTSKMRPFCKGFAVLMTPSVITSLVAASEHVPVFRHDDLYLYGILPFVAGGIKVYDMGNQRAFHDFGMTVVSCYKERGDNCPYVATKAFSSRFTSLWGFVTARREPGANRFQANPSLWRVSDYQRSFYT